MDFEVGGLPRAQNRSVAAKIIDFGVCELAVEGSGLKTDLGQLKQKTLT